MIERSDNMKVYEKVREYIVANGYKQVAIAKKAGIPNATFNAIMNGKRTLYADDLSSICIALNVSPELFIEIKNPCKNVTDRMEVI
ncbi:MAG: helix-turn-helix domain-containing protein [Lachnospiraceae bacterium]